MSTKSSTSIRDRDLSSEFTTRCERVILVRGKEEFFEIREGSRSSDNFKGPMVNLVKHIQKVQHIRSIVDGPINWRKGYFPLQGWKDYYALRTSLMLHRSK